MAQCLYLFSLHYFWTGELFAKAPIDKYPGIALEAVTDSSRYFVLRIEDDNGKYGLFI